MARLSRQPAVLDASARPKSAVVACRPLDGAITYRLRPASAAVGSYTALSCSTCYHQQQQQQKKLLHSLPGIPSATFASFSNAGCRGISIKAAAAARAGRTTAASSRAAAASPATGDPSPAAHDDELWYCDESIVRSRWRITDTDEKATWEGGASSLSRLAAQDAVTVLDLDYRLGLKLPPTGKLPPTWLWYLRAKTKNPEALILMRAGDAYEALGLDAAFLMEVGDLNAVPGGKDAAPRVSCPVELVHGLLSKLTDAGYKVAMWEERSEVPDSEAGRQLERFCTQVVSPESPYYLYGYAESSEDRDVHAPTVSGVSWGAAGVSAFRLNRASNRIEVFQGLSEDGLWGVVNADRSTPPVVYLHEPLDAVQHKVKSRASAQQQARSDLQSLLKAEGIRVKTYKAEDALQGFIKVVVESVGLKHDVPDLPAWDMLTWPGVRPLYLSTQQQLGLMPTLGVPQLLNHVVSDDCPKLARDALFSLLVAPPAHSVAAATRRAVQAMMMLDCPLPVYQASPSSTTPKKVVAVLEEREANDKFFQGLAEALDPVVASLDPQQCPPALAAIVTNTWPLLCHSLALRPDQLSQQQVLDAAAAALAAIESYIADAGADGEYGVGSTGSSSEEGEDDEEDEAADADDHDKGSNSNTEDAGRVASTNGRVPGSMGNKAGEGVGKVSPELQLQLLVDRLAVRVEVFRGRVKDAAMRAEVQKVDAARSALLKTLDGLLESCNTTAAAAAADVLSASGKSGDKGIDSWPTSVDQLLQLDDVSSGIYLKLPAKLSPVLKQALTKQPIDLVFRVGKDEDGGQNEQLHQEQVAVYEQVGKQQLRPVDEINRGGLRGRFLTCPALDDALSKYKAAVSDANLCATQVLRDLAQQLAAHQQELAAAVQLGILLAALLGHARAAVRAGWTVPLVGQQQQQQQQLESSVESNHSSADAAERLVDSTSSVPAAGDGSSGSSSSSSEVDDVGVFDVRGLWPYWMDGSDVATVKNDVQLPGMMLLTGPNMAGKSTMLRSVAAAALCGLSGFAIPASSGSRLPLLDAVMLRTFSGDAPQQGLSAFGMEMWEMRYVLQDIRAQSLVLVDELGKGTEILWGTALASSMLRQLVAVGARGVFATHLHLLLDLLKDVDGLKPHRMEVIQSDTPYLLPDADVLSDDGTSSDASGTGSVAGGSSSDTPGSKRHLVPTMRLLPGSCTDSLAVEVARQQGLPEHVLQIAHHYFEQLLEIGEGRREIVYAAADANSDGEGWGDRGAVSESERRESGQAAVGAAAAAAAQEEGGGGV